MAPEPVHEVADQLGFIGSETATQARLAKNFRNHTRPGRAVRFARGCDRGTLSRQLRP